MCQDCSEITFCFAAKTNRCICQGFSEFIILEQPARSHARQIVFDFCLSKTITKPQQGVNLIACVWLCHVDLFMSFSLCFTFLELHDPLEASVNTTGDGGYICKFRGELSSTVPHIYILYSQHFSLTFSFLSNQIKENSVVQQTDK